MTNDDDDYYNWVIIQSRNFPWGSPSSTLALPPRQADAQLNLSFGPPSEPKDWLTDCLLDSTTTTHSGPSVRPPSNYEVTTMMFQSASIRIYEFQTKLDAQHMRWVSQPQQPDWMAEGGTDGRTGDTHTLSQSVSQLFSVAHLNISPPSSCCTLTSFCLRWRCKKLIRSICTSTGNTS